MIDKSPRQNPAVRSGTICVTFAYDARTLRAAKMAEDCAGLLQ